MSTFGYNANGLKANHSITLVWSFIHLPLCDHIAYEGISKCGVSAQVSFYLHQMLLRRRTSGGSYWKISVWLRINTLH